MRKSLGLLLILVLSVVAFGNNAPPGLTHDEASTVIIPATDNFLIDLPAVEIHPNYVFETIKAAPVYETSDYEYTMFMVREVTTCRKISVNTTASGYATKAENAVILCSTDPIEVTYKSICRYSTNRQTKNTNKFQRNYQHSNFGYPLTAN